MGNVVIPVHNDGSVHRTIEQLLRIYDPDHVVQLPWTAGDEDAISPGFMEELLDRTGINEPDSRAFNKDLLGAEDIPMSEVTAALDRLGNELPVHRLSPVDDRPHHQYISFKEIGPPLTQLPDTQEIRAAQDAATSIQFLGDLSVAIRRGAKSVAHEVDSDTQPTSRLSYLDALLPVNWTLTDSKATSIFNPGLQGLAQLTAKTGTRSSNLLVAGSAPDDFALALLWDRTHTTAIWIPDFDELTTSELERLSARMRTIESRAEWMVTSTSLPEDSIKAKIEKPEWRNPYLLSDASPTRRPSSEYVPPTALECDVTRLLACADHWDYREYIPVIDEHRVLTARSPLTLSFPKVISNVPNPSWETSVIAYSRPIPAHTSLVGHLAEDSNAPLPATLTRPSQNGIAYSSERIDFVHAGASIHGKFARPLLRWPDAWTCVLRAAQKNSATIRPSAAGRRTRYLLEDLWRSRSQLVDDLSGEASGLFREFVRVAELSDDPRDGRTFRRDAVVALHTNTVRDVGDASSDAGAWRVTIDRLVGIGALRRGMVLGCERCPYVQFYAVDDVSHTFLCKRCGFQNALLAARWQSGRITAFTEPSTWYGINPVLLEMLSNNGAISLLGGDACADFFKGSSLACEEFELIVNGEDRPLVEFDFAVVVDSRLLVGEAKSIDSFGQGRSARRHEFKKLIDGCERLHADVLCVTTSEPQWKTSEIEELQRLIDDRANNGRWAPGLLTATSIGSRSTDARIEMLRSM